MAYKSFTEEALAAYRERYLENSDKLSYRELEGAEDTETVLYRDLPNTEVKGYPFANDYADDDGRVYSLAEFDEMPLSARKKLKLRFHFLPKYHELYVGTTGSGKTTGCMEPQLRAISSQNNKPNLFITDPKGELFCHNADHLKSNGYKTYILNFKDFALSDRWNPLGELYRKQAAIRDEGNDAVTRTGVPGAELFRYGEDGEFTGAYIEYDGKAFPSRAAFNRYVGISRDMKRTEVSSLVNELASQMIPVTSQVDRAWEQGAQNLLKGLLLILLDEVNDTESGFDESLMTLKTLNDYYRRLRHDFVDSDERLFLNSCADHPLLKGKPDEAIYMITTALCNAPNTSRSYCGVFEGAINMWMQGHIFALTTGNTIDVDDSEPFAIFIATRDYDKSDYVIAGAFINWVYRRMLLKAEEKTGAVSVTDPPRATHFMLDEFCNIPRITDFENKIATARSRNIWFHLFVQSYDQLDLVYGDKLASVIRDNCNAQIFLGSQSRSTKERFSAECGKTWVPSVRTYFDSLDRSMTEVAVVPVSDLDLIREGEIYVKRLYMPVVLSQFVRSYKCAEQGEFADFYRPDAFRRLAPKNLIDYTSAEHTYKKLEQEIEKNDDFDFPI